MGTCILNLLLMDQNDVIQGRNCLQYTHPSSKEFREKKMQRSLVINLPSNKIILL